MTARSDTFVDDLLRKLEVDPRVVGLVLAGSSADTTRRDQWSDHDFLVIVDDDVAEHFRGDLFWLPDDGDLAFSFRETEHGLKALYRDGLMLEFAVFSRDQFAGCALNHYRVALDRGGIEELAAEIQGRSLQPQHVDRVGELRNFLSLVYIGTGRARRGERLGANALIRQWAVVHLLMLVRDLLDDTRMLDALDSSRRFETADPGFAADVDAALATPITDVGRELLQVADRVLAERWPDYPRHELLTVADLLGWSID